MILNIEINAVEGDCLPATWYLTGFNLKKLLATTFYPVSASFPAWTIKENYTDA